MKKILLITFLGLLICSCTSTKNEKIKMKYFDENNVQITKSEFKKKRSTNDVLDIPGDSNNHVKLTLRVNHGSIDREKLQTFLENKTNQKIDSTKPMVIIYHPGKDICNTNIRATKESIKLRYKKLEDGLVKVAQTKPIYIYKEYEGLELDEGIVKWHKDPEEIIERLFFKHHYPCSSFVVISKNGDYISRFGEFGDVYLWTVTQQLNE